VLRLTLLTSAVASATFVATIAYAPVVVSLGERLAFGQAAESTRKAPPVVVAEQTRDCRSIVGRIVAGLRSDPCPEFLPK
jgi:hypothetical protein